MPAGKPELAPPTTVRFPKELRRKLLHYARPRWRSLTSVIIAALDEYLERHQNDPLPRP